MTIGAETALDVLHHLRALMEQLRTAGWEVNLAIETDRGREALTFSASKGKRDEQQPAP